jgi:hypothetical protein
MMTAFIVLLAFVLVVFLKIEIELRRLRKNNGRLIECLEDVVKMQKEFFDALKPETASK